MKIEIVRTTAGFDALEPEWQRLHDASDQRRNPFAGFGWHRQVLRTLKPLLDDATYELVIAVARRKGKAEIIVPFILSVRMGLRSLSFIGKPVSQYGDVIAMPGKNMPHLIGATLKFVAEETRADVLVMERVRGDSAVVEAIEASPHTVLRRLFAPCVRLDTFDTPEAYMRSSTSVSRRKKQRRLWRRLDEQATVKFETIRPGPEALAATHEILALKRRMLAEHGTYSRGFADPLFEAYFLDVARDSTSDTGLEISTLKSGDALVAAEIGFKSNDAYVAHIGVIDSAYRKFGPGHLQMEQTVRRLFAEGIKLYDFLAPEDEYKRVWSNASVPVNDYAVPFSFKGSMYCKIARLRDPATSALKKVVPGHLIRYAAKK